MSTISVKHAIKHKFTLKIQLWLIIYYRVTNYRPPSRISIFGQNQGGPIINDPKKFNHSLTHNPPPPFLLRIFWKNHQYIFFFILLYNFVWYLLFPLLFILYLNSQSSCSIFQKTTLFYFNFYNFSRYFFPYHSHFHVFIFILFYSF